MNLIFWHTAANVNGALKLPKKGYQSLTINGNGHTLSFTGNIKLTGNTVVKDTVLKKLDKKGRQQSSQTAAFMLSSERLKAR